MLKYPRVIIVLLRRPSTARTERRDDPFWESGSFGCTGCHNRNLMNPKRAYELNGARLAFVQGGPLGFRLVHVTPEIWIEPTSRGVEARWRPGQMPLRYSAAPLVIDNDGATDIPILAAQSDGIHRSTAIARFASAFRSRRMPVAGEIGAAIIACYRTARTNGRIAKSYTDAMPRPPAIVELDRLHRYRTLRRPRQTAGVGRKSCGHER